MKTFRWSAWLPHAGALLASASLLAACQVERPEGAYVPTKRVRLDGDPSLFDDAGAGNGGGGDNPPPPTTGGGNDPDGGTVPSDSPLAKVQGYYWVRTDIEFTVSESQFSTTVEVFNRASHMALTRLTADGDVLRAIERTCHVFYQHECQRNCDTFTTNVATDAASLYRAIDPARVYTLTNSNKMFVTDAVALPLGWTGDANKMPTSIADATVWDVNRDGAKDGLYVNVKVTGLPAFGGSSDLDCYFNTVERFTSAYSGELKNGSLDGVTATLNTTGSDARRLQTGGDSTCSSSVTSPPASRSIVRFKKVEVGANPDEFWSCPSLADFKTKLADP